VLEILPLATLNFFSLSTLEPTRDLQNAVGGSSLREGKAQSTAADERELTEAFIREKTINTSYKKIIIGKNVTLNYYNLLFLGFYLYNGYSCDKYTLQDLLSFIG